MAQDHSQFFLCATQNQETLIKFNRGLTFVNNRERSLQQIQRENSNPLALSPSLQISMHCPFQLCGTNQEKCPKKIMSSQSFEKEPNHYDSLGSTALRTLKILCMFSLTFQCVAALGQSVLQVVLHPHGLQSHLALLGSYVSPTKRKRYFLWVLARKT